MQASIIETSLVPENEYKLTREMPEENGKLYAFLFHILRVRTRDCGGKKKRRENAVEIR